MSKNHARGWPGPKIGTLLAVLSVLGLAFAAFGWLTSPGNASVAYGVPIVEPENFAYGRIKGIQDLTPAILIAAFMLLGQRRSAGIVLLVSLLVPLGDLALVYEANGMSNPALLAIHIPYVVVMGLGAVLLLREPPAQRVPQTRASPVRMP